MPLPDTIQAAEQFVESLESVAWFSRIGQPIAQESGVCRIAEWQDWPGPEDETVYRYCTDEQLLFDRILNEHTGHKSELEALHQLVTEVVLRHASRTIPFDPTQDSWHGPTAAVWFAAFTAGLVALHIRIGRTLPARLQESWRWLLAGHWPCGFANLDENGEPGPLLVH